MTTTVCAETQIDYAVIPASQSVLSPNPKLGRFMMTDIFLNSQIPPDVADLAGENIVGRRKFLSIFDYKTKSLCLLPGFLSYWLNDQTILTYATCPGSTFLVYEFIPEINTIKLKQKITIDSVLPVILPFPGGNKFLVETKDPKSGYMLNLYDIYSKQLQELFVFKSLLHGCVWLKAPNQLVGVTETNNFESLFYFMDIDKKSIIEIRAPIPNITALVSSPELGDSQTIPNEFYVFSETRRPNQAQLLKCMVEGNMIITHHVADNVLPSTVITGNQKNGIYVSRIKERFTRIVNLKPGNDLEETITNDSYCHSPVFSPEYQTLFYFVSNPNRAEGPKNLKQVNDVLYEKKANQESEAIQFSSITWLGVEGGKIYP
jgi:hypothetical protein